MGLEEIRRLKQNSGKLPEKKIYWLPKVSKKRAALLAAQKETNGNEDTELVIWYKTKMERSPMRCENCFSDLSNYSEEDWFGSQHHIFEKSIFPSVKTHPSNHGVFGKWCCHSQWHSSLLNASKMPFFKIAIERFIMFEPDIKERNRIPGIYLQEIKSFY